MYISPNEKPENQVVNKYANLVNHDMTWANDELVLDDHYRFNRKYFSEAAGIYGGYGAAVILQTAIVLPFHLPFEKNVYSQPVWLTKKTGSFDTFLFNSFPEQKKFLCGFLPEYAVAYDQFRTRCEMVSMLRADSVVLEAGEVKPLELARIVRQSKYTNEISGEQFLSATKGVFSLFSKLVESALEAINSIIMSYAVQLRDDTVFPLEIAAVEHLSHFRIIEPKEWTTYNWIRLNNTHIPKDPFPELTDQTFADILGGAQHYLQDRSVLHQWYVQRAMYAHQAGSSLNCVIYLVTSVEVLIREVFALSLRNEEKASPDEINERIEETTFKKLLVAEMSSILGGKWSLEDENAPVASWYKDVYQLRNRIVHGGYIPSEREITSAIVSSENFRSYVHSRIAENLKKKPYLRVLSPVSPPSRLVKKEFGNATGTSENAS